jgi:4-hydroxythreonine-4-phosphate dehydrogenase
MKMPHSPSRKPVLGITAGDPAGIGPEIIARFFSEFEPKRSSALIIGAPGSLRLWADRFGLSCPIIGSATEMAEIESTVPFGVYILDNGCRDDVPVGVHCRQGGQHAGSSIDLACRLARAGVIQAIVTAPISKESLNLAGYPFSGHTEMLADRLASPNCQMMMVYNRLRVVPATRHIPLLDVPKQVTETLLDNCLAVVHRALGEHFGIGRPRIALAALNPHAGEGGVLGTEEIEVIMPAIERAGRNGMQVEGPFAADSLFQTYRERRYDAYVTMYHDQGLIPFKMVARKRGVNVTVGLPVIRTSVDHGVAFDIAGRGVAGTASLAAAYRLAERIAGRRRRDIPG